MLPSPFCVARVVRLPAEGSVIYRAKEDRRRRFLGLTRDDVRGGPKPDFQVFSALDFLVDVTRHISVVACQA